MPGSCAAYRAPPGRCAAARSFAGSAASRARSLRGPRDHHRRVLLEDAQPDLLDLVAQRRGPLELELLGRRPHLGLHLGDQPLDLRLVGRGEVLVADAPSVYITVFSATARSRSLMSWMPLMMVVRLDAVVGVVRAPGRRAGGPSPRSRPSSTR